MEERSSPTHPVVIAYVIWIFGFMGCHRFYFGKKLTGVIWFFTLGLLFIGWIIDLFLIPSMSRQANFRYSKGPYEYSIGWVLLTFFGWLGVHRFYMQKWITAILYLLTFGLFGIGILYDLFTLNEQIDDLNRFPAERRRF